MACGEWDWTVVLCGTVVRKVRVATLTVNPQIAMTTTNSRQRDRWYFVRS